MIIEYSTLVEVLDKSGIPNQDVPAAMALVVRFGREVTDEDVSYDAVDETGLQLHLNREGRLVEIEFS